MNKINTENTINGLSKHSIVLLRDSLGIKAEVTQHQLEQIEQEQLHKDEPYILQNVTPLPDHENSHHDQI